MVAARVLIVDDSPLARRAIGGCLAHDPGIEIAGYAGDAYEARELIAAKAPDVVTLDLEMPRMNGLEFLKRLMAHYPLPVVVISSLTQAGSEAALEAMRCGAFEVMAKPADEQGLRTLKRQLPGLVRAAAGRGQRRREGVRTGEMAERGAARAGEPSRALVVVGASTGGVEAVEQLLRGLPAGIPGVLIAQHMPAVFSRTFAAHLAQATGLAVREATHGEMVRNGEVLIAPGDYHLRVRRREGGLFAEVSGGPRVQFHRPSVDVLFRSVAEAGVASVGVLLTGMGNDGAVGMGALQASGQWTIAQDEASCVVFGMPAAAIAAGAAAEVLPMWAIAGGVMRALQRLPVGG